MQAEHQFDSDESIMRYAIELAAQGFGTAEPNPLVGAVIVTPQRHFVAAGYHQRCGEAHAEAAALRQAGEAARGNDLFVTLEPCSHTGRTPPCADAVIRAGIRRVVAGCEDPAPWVAGKGLQKLRDAGIAVECGCCEAEARDLIAPFRKRVTEQLPWVHAKWAMTLDGRIAADSGHSQWISGADSRAIVHELRGRMDAIITGAGTVRGDDPLLTARPPGPRTPLRVVLDSTGQSLHEQSQLVTSRDQGPVLVCVSARCEEDRRSHLRQLGLEVLETSGDTQVCLTEVLQELARRELTHVLLEAGPGLLGTAFDARLVDEVHVFVAPKIVGGSSRASAVGGHGLQQIPGGSVLHQAKHRACGTDMLIEGRMIRLPQENS